MKIVLGADHAGFDLKKSLLDRLRSQGHDVVDLGTDSAARSVDYPDFASGVASTVAEGEADRGVLVCGTGIGVAITANKVAGIRAATCNDLFTARMSRAHNDINVLALGARVVGQGVAEEILDLFLTTSFEKGRHQSRVAKIHELEGQNQVIVSH